jgi:hypothetical protein
MQHNRIVIHVSHTKTRAVACVTVGNKPFMEDTHVIKAGDPRSAYERARVWCLRHYRVTPCPWGELEKSPETGSGGTEGVWVWVEGQDPYATQEQEIVPLSLWDRFVHWLVKKFC